MQNVRKLVLTWLLLASFLVVANADDVVDTLQGAIKSYENGEYTIAVEDINYALQLIQQKKGQSLENFLPEALSGWNAQKAESQSAGAAMFGGGITTSKEYTKGSSRIKVEIITDSPVMQSMMMIFSNPMFAASDGGKMERIGREKAIVKYDEEREDGEITVIVDKRFMIRVEGNKVSLDDMRAYAKAIDFNKISKMP